MNKSLPYNKFLVIVFYRSKCPQTKLGPFLIYLFVPLFLLFGLSQIYHFFLVMFFFFFRFLWLYSFLVFIYS